MTIEELKAKIMVITHHTKPDDVEERLADLCISYAEERVKEAITRLLPNDKLQCYIEMGMTHDFEYMGKTYHGCISCGFSPEALKDEMERITSHNKKEE